MVLEIRHIDLISGEYIPNPLASQRQEQPHWVERLENSLLECFCPEIPLSVGHLDDFYRQSNDPKHLQQAEQILQNHPEGHKLILANGKRFFYAPPEYEAIINEILAGRGENLDLKNRGAYASLLTSPQKSTHTQKATILIVDDETGDNGGILDELDAWKLTGDCHGKMSPTLAKEVFQTDKRAIQFRIGLLEEKYIGKGTLTPRWLDGNPHPHFRRLQFKEPNNIPKIDLVLPLSSFKGTAKGHLQPGLITTQIVITEKERSRTRGERGSLISASQPLQYYTEALMDTIPLLEERLGDLQKAVKDPRILEALYLKANLREVERIPDIQDDGRGEVEDDLSLETIPHDKRERFEDLVAQLIENDPHGQLRETEFYRKKLEQFQAKQWLECATGKLIKFNRAIVIPSKDLRLGELYCNRYLSDQSVLGFRSPMISKNGLRVSVNTPVEEGLAPDGSPLQGVLVMNDVSWTGIHQQLSRQLTEAIALDRQSQVQSVLEKLPTPKELKDSSGQQRVDLIDNINTQLKPLIESGIPLTPLPYETDNEADQLDFDGDTYGFELERNYPHLGKAARKHREHPDIPVKKEEKLSFDPSWSFERIALFMANSPVGMINNQVVTVQSLKNELALARDGGKPFQKVQYAQNLVNTANRLIAAENRDKHPQAIPLNYRKEVYQIAQLTPTLQNCPRIFELYESIYNVLLQEAQYQNQIAVDMFKSGRSPEVERIKQDKKALYRQLKTITAKKEQGLYLENRTLPATGVTPIELMTHLTNQAFLEESLESRPLHQWREFFPTSFDEQQLLEVTQVKGEFDRLWNQATTLRHEQETEPGPVLNLTTAKGNTVRITNILAFENFLTLPANLEVFFRENQEDSFRSTHQLLATSLSEEGETQILGTVKESDRIKFNIQPGMRVTATGKVSQNLSHEEIDLLFEQAFTFAREWKESLPPEQIQAYFGATGHLSSRELKHPHPNTAQNFLFATFASEIIEQSRTFQFKEWKVDGLSQFNQVPAELFNSTDFLDLRISPITVNTDQGARRVWEVYHPSDEQWYTLGLSSEQGAQLPLGTRVQGKITGENPATARLHLTDSEIAQKIQSFLPEGGEIIFGQINKYAAAGQVFNGQTQTFTLRRFTPQTEYLVSLEDKPLGVLDATSMGKLKSGDFNATLTTYGDQEGRYAIATLEDGSKLRINKIAFRGHDEIRNKSFLEETVQLKLKATPGREEIGIETLIEGEPQIIGVFGSHHQQNLAKKAFAAAGLLQDGLTFQATITSRLTLVKIEIDPNTLQYPPLGEWTQTTDLSKSSQPSLTPDVAYFLDQVSTHPTLLSHQNLPVTLPDGQTTLVPTFRISVDVRKVATVEKFLSDQNIPFSLSSSSPEKQRGMVTLTLLEQHLPPSLRDKLEAKFGLALDETSYQQHLGEITPFSLLLQKEFATQYAHYFEFNATETQDFLLSDLIPLANAPPSPTPAQDLEAVTEGIIVHPVNGQGIRKNQITAKYPQILNRYQEKQELEGWHSGEVQFVKINDQLWVANVAILPLSDSDVDAVAHCFTQVKAISDRLNLPVYCLTPDGENPYTEQLRGVIRENCPSTIIIHPPEKKPVVISEFSEKNLEGRLTSSRPEGRNTDLEASGDGGRRLGGRASISPHTRFDDPHTDPLNTEILYPPINIASNSPDPLGAALTNPTETARYYWQKTGGQLGCEQSYPVSFRDNPERPAVSGNDGYYKAEKYFSSKPHGVPFVSAEDAYKFYARNLQTHGEREALMAEILVAKLTQHPQLFQEIEQRGGLQWLETCSHIARGNNPAWEGIGRNSGFIRALSAAYQRVLCPTGSLPHEPLEETIPRQTATQEQYKEPNPKISRDLPSMAEDFSSLREHQQRTLEVIPHILRLFHAEKRIRDLGEKSLLWVENENLVIKGQDNVFIWDSRNSQLTIQDAHLGHPKCQVRITQQESGEILIFPLEKDPNNKSLSQQDIEQLTSPSFLNYIQSRENLSVNKSESSTSLTP